MTDSILNDRQIAELKKLFWKKAAAREHITSAQITEVNRDSQNMRVVSVKATVDGVPDQFIGGISEGAALAVGDTVEVGRPSVQKVNPAWSFKRVVSSTLPFGVTLDTNTTVPTPTGLTLTSSSYEPTPGGLLAKITATWSGLQDSYGIDRYVVAYRTNSDTDWHESSIKHATGLNGGTQSYLLTGLQPVTTYNLKVKAVAKNGSESEWSDVSTIETSGDTTAPAVPTGLAGTATTLQNVLSWDRNTEYDFNYFNVYSASGSAPDSWTLQTQAKRNGWTHTGSAYDTYYYSLEAVDNSGNTSDKCDSAGPFTMLPVSTDPVESDVTPPPVVSDSDFVYTTSIEKDANGNWRPFIVLSVTSGPSNYVKPSDFSHFVFKLIRTSDSAYKLYNTNTSSETSVRISEWLDFGTAYTAQALGQDKTGNQSAWNTTPESITTDSPDTPPDPLVAPTLSTSFKLMKVAFTWIDNDNIDYVEYQRATDSGFSADLFTFHSNGYQSPPGGSGTFWIIDGTDATYPLTPNTRYYYRYRFRNFGGFYSSSWSPSSNEVVSQIGASDIVANSITANQISAGTITATEIAANTITSDKLTIGGHASNLVLNPGAEDGLVSWQATTANRFSISTNADLAGSVYAGTNSFKLDTTAGGVYVVCRAFPIIPGQIYAVRLYINGSAARADGLYLRAHCAADLPSAGYILQSSPGYTLASCYQNGVAQNNVAIPDPWTAYNLTFTAPAGCYWASFAVFNYHTATATQVYFDEVEVYKQFNTVHIADGVITADKLEANLVIANTIIAGTAGAARVQLNSSGIIGYNSSDIALAGMEASTGKIYGSHVSGGNTYRVEIDSGRIAFLYNGTEYGEVISKSTAPGILGIDALASSDLVLTAGANITVTLDRSAGEMIVHGNIAGDALIAATGSLRTAGDSGGSVSTITITNSTQGISSGIGTVRMNGTTGRSSTGWFKIYAGLFAKYVPYWDTVTG